MEVVDLVLPVFAVIVTGWLAGQLGYISRSLADGLVHFAYNVAMLGAAIRRCRAGTGAQSFGMAFSAGIRWRVGYEAGVHNTCRRSGSCVPLAGRAQQPERKCLY